MLLVQHAMLIAAVQVVITELNAKIVCIHIILKELRRMSSFFIKDILLVQALVNSLILQCTNKENISNVRHMVHVS